MKELTRCLICASSRTANLYPATYTGTVEEAHHYFLANRRSSAHGSIDRCLDCGFVFTGRQFEEADYDAIYARIPRPDESSVGGPGAAATRARFGRLKRFAEAHADFRQPFLDFGCGSGEFLSVVASPTGTGFEVGAPSERPGPAGSRILTGAWSRVAGSPALPWGSQHLVTAFDVLEHLSSLERDVSLLRRALRPGGTLVVTVPDVASPIARLSGRRWNMLLLEHLWYFSGATLDLFMRRFGFEPTDRRSVPYDAALGHIAKRASESLGVTLPRLPRWVENIVIPAPAGVLFAAYRAND